MIPVSEETFHKFKSEISLSYENGMKSCLGFILLVDRRGLGTWENICLMNATYSIIFYKLNNLIYYKQNYLASRNVFSLIGNIFPSDELHGS